MMMDLGQREPSPKPAIGYNGHGRTPHIYIKIKKYESGYIKNAEAPPIRHGQQRKITPIILDLLCN